MQSDGFNSALSPVVYGDIALSINTQYNTIQCLTVCLSCAISQANYFFVSIFDTNEFH